MRMLSAEVIPVISKTRVFLFTFHASRLYCSFSISTVADTAAQLCTFIHACISYMLEALHDEIQL